MKLAVRIGLYVVLVFLAAYFFGRFRSAYSTTRGINASTAELLPADDRPGDTNTSPPATFEGAVTDAAQAREPGPSDTTAATSAGLGTSNAPLAMATAPPKPPVAVAKRSDSFKYLGLFVAFFLALGGLAAWDLSQYLGDRAGRAVMADDWVERKDPQYEKAEEEWSKGNHLDAISMMREYLGKNPQEQHVAIRIAEIYEKDLGNFLAAALELQDVLTKRLPKEKWGWTAVRLANIYSGRLNQSDKAIALLERIVNEYGGTAAARKARSRLGIPEPVDAAPASPAEEPAPPPEDVGIEPDLSEPPPPPDPSSSNLPKGFRPKK